MNPKAVCSSQNYELSKKLHKEYLEREHSSFVFTGFRTNVSSHNWHPEKVTVRVFGKPTTVSWAEYKIHYEPLGFKWQ